MIVRVKLFAVARQRVEKEAIDVDLSALSAEIDRPSAATMAQLRSAISNQYPQLADVVARSRLAVNNEYAAEGTPIPQGAEVALIPPVSGG